jgi:hypothetical protein
MVFRHFLLSGLLLSIFSAHAFADDVCIHCTDKKMQGLPDINNKLLNVISKVAQPAPPPEDAGKKIPFSSYQDGYCMKFTYLVRNQVAGFTKELEESPFPIDDYFQKSGCRQKSWGGDVLSPMLHLIADDPAGRVEFADVIYKYYTIKRKDQAAWLKAVNAKNTVGETVLDYLDHCVQIGNFFADESKAAVTQIINSLCAKGAVYSKYNKKCPGQ